MIRRSSVDSTPTTLPEYFNLMVALYAHSTDRSNRTLFKKSVTLPPWLALGRSTMGQRRCILISSVDPFSLELYIPHWSGSWPKRTTRSFTRSKFLELYVRWEISTGQIQPRSARSSHKSTETPPSTDTRSSSLTDPEQYQSGWEMTQWRWVKPNRSGANVSPQDPTPSTPHTPRATEREPGGTCGSRGITRKLGSLPLCVESLLVAQEVAARTQRLLQSVERSLTPWWSCSATRASMGGTFKSYRLTFASRALRGPVEVIVSWPVSLSCPTSENPRPERSSRHAKKEGLRPGPI